jgi:transposase
LKQVVLGIVLDDADRPIASFLMPGNTADVTLLLPLVKRLRERFGIRQTCIVADRGMISADTIAALEAEKIEYILGVRERTSREVRAEIIEDDGLAVPLLIPRRCERDSSPEQAPRLHAGPQSPADPGDADGFNRHKRCELHIKIRRKSLQKQCLTTLRLSNSSRCRDKG